MIIIGCDFHTRYQQLLAAILSIILAAPLSASTYDPVGNRTQKVSTLPGYPGGTSNYNANDQLSTDTYDNDGNTTASNGLGYAYDFENHLIQQGGISIVYDGDGNRVSKTVAGVTTQYMVDTQNPTGYAQVVQEITTNSAGTSTVAYICGLERISQRRDPEGQPRQISWYVYDGHGSVRALADQTSAVTDTYDYDAFGNLIHSTGTTPNNYLFAGEQFDPDLGLYYNRARYLNVSTGRFWSMDTIDGDPGSPSSLHKYLYAAADPVLGTDPSGNATLVEEEEVAEESAAEDVGQLQLLEAGQKGINLAKFAAAVAAGVALAAEGDNNPPQPPVPGEQDRRQVIPLFRDASGINPGAFSFTGGSCPFITSEVSLLEVPKGDKGFTIRFTAIFDPPKVTCVTKGSIIDPDLADLGLGVVYLPTLTPGHWSLIAKSYVPTKDEQEAIKKRLSVHAKNPAYQH